jgi:Secretion system C-terminal sorting domain
MFLKKNINRPCKIYVKMKYPLAPCKSCRPTRKSFLQKSLISLTALLCLTTVSIISNAQTIWNTGSSTFSFTGAGQQDCITAQTCLTRTTVFFNSVCQTVSGQQSCSYTGPCNTEWSIGNIANWNTLTYERLYGPNVNNCNPPSIIGIPLVGHLIAENIYLQLTFNSWNPGTNGNFSYTRSTGSTLPVLLSEFTGYKTGSMNVLNWTSGTENNFSHYNIQRSSNGTDFITLGRVDSKSVNGNSSTDLDYNYADAHPAAGHNRYRLEQVDKDGHNRYSKIIDLFNSNSGSTIVILQSDAGNLINIYISSTKTSTATIKLADMNGRIVRIINASIMNGSNNLQVRLDDMAKGIYVVQVYEDARFSFSGKVIK